MVKRVLSIGLVSLLLVGLIPYLMLDVEATPDSNNDFTEAVEVFNVDSIVESLDDIDDLTDFYKIYLSGGDKLVANMTVPLGVDFELYLWDSSYNPIDASENDNTLTPYEEVTTTATIEGYYYVNASVYSGSGTYILNFTATANWTIMVYLGDCDLEGDLITDINNMEKLGSDANVNIIVQFDRWDGTNGDPAKDDTSNGDWTDTRRFYVIEDTINPNDGIIRSKRLDDTVELPALGDLDSADSQTLIDFVNWTINKYPANYYTLIFGAHGDGWLGLMVETSGFPADEMLNMSDLAYALNEITEGGNNKLDIIGFDACLMAMLEVDYQIRPYVDYTVGSEELLYPWALDDVLANLTNNPSMSPEQLVTQIVDNYNYTYTITSPGYSNLTQSAVNLSKVGDELLVDNNTTALWHFNEGTGDVVYDETLNDNDGTLGPVWGFALEFDGVDDYVKVDDHESLDCSGNTTWELWFNANDLSQVYTRLLSKSSTQGWAIYTNYNIIRLYANISGLWQGILFCTALNVNQWYHLGIVRNGDLWTLYLDGENVDSNTVSGDMKLNTEDVYIGSHSGGNQFFNGTIDELRISNIARDPSTGYWKQPLTADANTVALWHFDEGIDQYTYNVTTPGNDGVLGSSTGVDSSDPEWVTSAVGHPEWVSGSSALRFDGVDDYIDCGNDTSLDITNEITIEAWIKPKELPSEYETIVGKWDYGTNSRCYWLAHKYTGEISFFISKDGLDYKSLSYPASLNEWAHFAGVFDGNELKLYKNGELVDGPKTYQYSINSEPALHTWIGADGDNSIRYFNGIIDEVRISNRTRTSEEIAENANTHTISAIDTLGNDLRSTLNAYVNYINYSRNSTEEYQTDNNNYIDLYHFAENIYNNVPDVIIQTDALTVMNTIDNCVLNNWNNFDRLNSHGISIYFPKNSTVYNNSYASDPYFYFPQDTCWDEFLVDYYDVPMNNPPSIDSFDPATDPTIYEVHSQTFMISASDPDNNALMYKWYINGSIEEETGDTYTFNANDFSTGIYEIEVYVFDGHPDGVDGGFTEYDYCNWTLTVIPVKNWTFMVYLDGDNNLEGSGIDDFLEMASVGSSAEVNIIVQFDRIMGEDDRYDDWDTCKRYNITQGMTPTIANALEDIGEVNMGEPQTLINFTNWAISDYPAEHYALILWDHGMHWYGVCSDDTTGGDHLNMSELYNALDTIYTDNSNLILDIIDFDACLMGTVEVAYQIGDYVNYMIASEKTEPGAGLDYNNSLDALINDPSMTPIEFCDQLLSDYENYYLSTLGTPDEYLLDRSFTLSVTDLNTINDLVSAIDNLTMELYNNKESWVNYVNYSRNQTETYDGPYGGDHKVIDLYHFAQQLYRYVPNTTIRLLATELKNATYTTIKNETHGTNPANPEVIVENAHGLTIYYPVTKGEYDNKYESKPNFYFTQDTYWDEFLNAYYNMPTNNPPSVDSYYPLTDPTINESHSQTFTVTAFDPDENTLVYEWYLDGELIEGETKDLYTFMTNYTSSDIYNITVNVYDGVPDGEADGFTLIASHQWDLIVNDVINPPIVGDIPDIYFDEDGSYNSLDLDDYVTDIDNTDAEIIWSCYGNISIIVSIDEIIHMVTFTAPENWSGSEIITFVAEDPHLATGNDYATVTVNPINDPPVVSNIPDICFDEDGLNSSLDLNYYVYDSDDTNAQITWNYTENINITVSINSTTHIVTFGALGNWSGNETMVFTAKDPYLLSDSDTVTLTVNPINDAPVVLDLPDINFDEDGSYSSLDLDDYVTDIDNIDAEITWTCYGNTNIIVSVDEITHIVTFTALENWSGSETIWFITKDPSGASDSDFAIVTINPVDDAPILIYGNVTPSYGDTNTLFKFTVVYLDLEGNIPTIILVKIDGISYDMKEYDVYDIVITDGKTYFYETSLNTSSHNYQFLCANKGGDYSSKIVVGPEVTQTVPPTGTIAGQVTDINTGAGIGNATITIISQTNESNLITTKTNSTGFYSKTVDIGLYYVSITRAAGYQVHSTTKIADVTPSEIITLNFQLSKILPSKGYIAGLVTDQYKVILSGVSIIIGGNEYAKTDTNGYYSFEIEVGAYNITAAKTGYTSNIEINYQIVTGINKLNFVLTLTGTKPELTNGTVSPSEGDTNTIFTFSVHYYDKDGDTPTNIQVWIDGDAHSMTLVSGDAANGVYEYSTKLSKGVHKFYFTANDGTFNAISPDGTPIDIDSAVTTKSIKEVSALPQYTLYVVVIILVIIIIILLALLIKSKGKLKKREKVETEEIEE